MDHDPVGRATPGAQAGPGPLRLLILAVVAFLAVGADVAPGVGDPAAITGPYAALLASSTDLGDSRSDRVQVTAALLDESAPERLTDWARDHGLDVRWRSGQPWAIVEGPPALVGNAFDVAVHDFRGRRGEVFYASRHQPGVPDALRREVTGFGRILSFTPSRSAQRWMVPRDVPDQGLSPDALVRTYEVEPLARQGFDGDGVTVVVFAFDGFDQADLDLFATTFGLPQFTPEVVGGMPTQRSGEATMDLEAIHAIAPAARKVLVNARPTVAAGAYEKIAAMMNEADRRYPGAVWSLSIGWGCDKLVTAADLAPVRSALRAAQSRGTTAFDASGDLAGLECKGGENWSTPPDADEIGLDAVASVPEMTNVGGTTLSTDRTGGWLSEQAWFDVPLSQGTGGGESVLFERPPWQGRIEAGTGADRRLTPDVAAVGDPETGVKIVIDETVMAGGGTSLAAPIWAGMAAVVNQYLLAGGGRLLGDLNPLLYEIAQGARLPAFRDITLGGNSVDDALPGYDLVAGLGTPRIANLAADLLALQKSWIGVR